MPQFHRFHWLTLTLAILLVTTSSLVAVFSTGSRAATASATQTITYQGSTQNFPNPERGFSSERILYYNGNTSGQNGWSGQGDLTLSDLQSVKQKGNDIVWVYYVLQNFASTVTPFETSCTQPYAQDDDEPLPQDFMTGLNSDLSKVRQAGLKIVLRFTYNFGPYMPVPPDAPLCRILGHIDQIAPVLQQNTDIIDFIEAGFVGEWGEWHDSTNGLFTNDSEGVGQVNSATTQIIDEELSQFPNQRMILLRYPRHTMELFGTTPLTASNAYNGSNLARIGAHNDCFLDGSDEGGTFQEGANNTITIQQQQQFWQQDNQYVPQFGETCAVNSPDTDCPNALTELAAYHFSSLNQDYDPDVLNGWSSCMSQIQEDLGYRFRLTQATIPTSVASGQTLNMSLDVANDGWANLFNPRDVELILTNQQNSAQQYTLPLNVDPRFWKDQTTTAVNISVQVPSSVPNGTYNLSLNLPDPASDLHDNPAYSIQLANTGVWDSTTGFNSLQASLQVGSSSGNTPTPTATTTSTATPTPTSTPTSGTSYEAEASTNTLAGGAVVASCNSCSGGKEVGYIGNGGTLTFNGVSASSTGSYSLTIYYLNGDSGNRNASLSVNSGSTNTLSFSPTGGWNNLSSLTITVTLNAGSNNTLEFSNPSGWAPDIDRIVVGSGGTTTPTPTPTTTPTPTPTPNPTTSYEAEASNNTLAGGAVVASCSACSGGEKVGYIGNGGTLTFNGVSVSSTGSYTVTIYYLNGDSGNRNANLSVNGGSSTTLTFSPTGGWNNVSSLTATVTLNAGSNNTLELSNSSGWAPDIDRIVIS